MDNILAKIDLEDVQRLVIYYAEWAESITQHTENNPIEAKLILPPWGWLREQYPVSKFDQLPANGKERIERIAKRALQLTLQDIFLPDFINASCIFFMISDCGQIMKGKEFLESDRAKQEVLEKFSIVLTQFLSLSKGRMIKSYVKLKYNRNVRTGTKDWKSAQVEIDTRVSRAIEACKRKDNF